ncbi:MAG: hypothetical protein R6U56_02090 [Opitutales bacterium]
MRFLTTLALLPFTLLGLNGLSAESWVRGSAVALKASGGVEITVPSDGVTYESFDQPRYFPGIFSCRAQSRGKVLIRTSNQMVLAFQGEGFFAVERFEGLSTSDQWDEDGMEETRSRMILNLRRGELMIDSRELSEASRLVLETPFGRIAGVEALLLVRIEFDQRSGIYDFTVSTFEGIVRLADLRQESYTVYPGQRISGAGNYEAPAVEIGKQTDEIREKFEDFLKSVEELDATQVDQSELQSHTRALQDSENVSTVSPASGEKRRRPRVIEFAPLAEPVTPFRGELKPSSDDQADLF